MILLSYDISNDKLRTKFSKFLAKFGHRIQYSVFEIENSEKLLNNLVTEIQCKFEEKFTESDSVMIFKMPASCEIIRMGYAKNYEKNVIIV